MALLPVLRQQQGAGQFGTGLSTGNLGLLGLMSGLGILAGNRPGASAGQAIGGGLLNGINTFSQLGQQAQMQQLRSLQIQQAKANMKATNQGNALVQNILGPQPGVAAVQPPAQPAAGGAAPGAQTAQAALPVPTATAAGVPQAAGAPSPVGRLAGLPGNQLLQLATQTAQPAVARLASQEINRRATKANKTPPASQQKIQEIMDTFGVDRQTAASVALGTTKISENPVDGSIRLVDMVNGTARTVPLAQQAQAGPAPAAQPGAGPPSLFSRAGQATGVVPALGETAQRIFGQFGSTAGSANTQARQDLRTASGELIRSLSINPRFPVAEMERIRNEVNIQPSILDSPPAMRDRMMSLEQSLARREANERKAAENEKLPVETRQNALSAANSIANFRGALGVPKVVSSDEQFDQLAPGTQFLTREKDGTLKLRIKPPEGQ